LEENLSRTRLLRFKICIPFVEGEGLLDLVEPLNNRLIPDSVGILNGI